MVLKNKKICDNCFSEIRGEPCPECGYRKIKYKPEVGNLSVGTVLHKKYHIGKVLGKGGFGVTYKAYDEDNDRIVAIKEYYPNGLAHRDTGVTGISLTDATQKDVFDSGASKFFDEAKTVSRFNGNPNIVSVYDFFYENGTVYYVMEYLEGYDLKKFISLNGGRLPQEKLMSVVDVITDALIITHSLNVLHRDISPDNIYILKNGDVKLIDFGAARQILAEQSKSMSVILKQGFAPLEQYQRKGKQGPWTDIYALGSTMYYTLTGKIPEDATERLENEDLGNPDEYGVNADLWHVIGKCMAVKISDRYNSVIELKEALKAIPIVPVPLVVIAEPDMNVMLDAGNSFNATIAVSEGTDNGELGATVAFSEAAYTENINKDDLENNQNNSELKKGSFFKSKTGMIILGIILLMLIGIIIIVVVSCSARRKNNTSGGNSGGEIVLNTTTTVEDTGMETTENNTVQKETTENITEETQPSTNETTTSTEAETTKPPQAPTTKPTQAATTKPTQAPTTKPTQAPTTKPTEETYVTDRAITVTVIGTTYSGFYTGEWKNGKPNGKGTFSRKSNYNTQKQYTQIMGNWSNGKLNGQGSVVNVLTGDYYPDGTFSMSACNWKYSDEAEIYVGEFIDGDVSGKLKLYYMVEGAGAYCRAGNVSNNTWTDDRIVDWNGELNLTLGTIADIINQSVTGKITNIAYSLTLYFPYDCYNERSSKQFYFQGEGSYTGEYCNGTPHGEGTFTYVVENQYVSGYYTGLQVKGTWYNGKLNGEGSIACVEVSEANVNIFDFDEGNWEYTGLSEIYVGNWSEGNPFGDMSIYYNYDGTLVFNDSSQTKSYVRSGYMRSTGWITTPTQSTWNLELKI